MFEQGRYLTKHHNNLYFFQLMHLRRFDITNWSRAHVILFKNVIRFYMRLFL